MGSGVGAGSGGMAGPAASPRGVAGPAASPPGGPGSPAGRAGVGEAEQDRSPAGWLSELDDEAARRQRAGLRRELRPREAGDDAVDLAGNDYLGLSRHPRVLAAAADALTRYGLGATGSRLVRGSTAEHAELEAGLAGLFGSEAALVYSSGYLANMGAVRALAGPGTLLLSDAYNHASIVDGCRNSRAEVVVVPHADVAAVERTLAGRGGRPAVLVTESVFSVDGDLAPLVELHAACRRHGALLLVDDAHAVGLLGPSGAGAVAAAGLAGAPDVVVTATLSKSFGAAGGVVAGPRALVSKLVDTGRTFIYDTALPPVVAAGALAALELIRDGDALRAESAERAALVGKRLVGHDVSEPAAGVVSVAAPGPDEAVAWAQACRERGVAVGCFRPPSTPDGRSRLRLTINVGVPRAAFEEALNVIAECAP
ncbi:8-amino-7-oxononanoate synthase [Rugosimonospora acidiphila]|uniref:8-amino-7-oxononanoate synthase n=1 Tax=Rugosimonospora acidiphila TaxID=556531 RepID=A0ABP9RNM8_9ACTN